MISICKIANQKKKKNDKCHKILHKYRNKATISSLHSESSIKEPQNVIHTGKEPITKYKNSANFLRSNSTLGNAKIADKEEAVKIHT